MQWQPYIDDWLIKQGFISAAICGPKFDVWAKSGKLKVIHHIFEGHLNS